MANLSITVSQVQAAASAATFGSLIAGEEIDPGETVYKKAADKKGWLGGAATEAEADVVGIAVCHAYAGQKVVYQKTGNVNLGAGASVAQGQVYVASATSGKIAVESDLGSGEYVTVLGVGNDADEIELDINASGIAHA